MLGPRRAVIDIGTNSVKLLVAEVVGQQVNPLWEESKQTRLGRGFYETHRLQAEPIASTARAVAKFAETAREWETVSLRVIATSAARDAVNSQDLLSAIQTAAGLPVEIISGEQEADWAFQGVTTDPELAKHPLLLLDVGGGSTEFILGHGKHQDFRHSFPLGTVRLLEATPPSDPPTSAELAACRKWLREFLREQVRPNLEGELRQERKFDPAHRCVALVGTGGTASLLARIEASMTDFDRARIEAARLGLDRVQWQVQRLWSLPLAERREILGLPANRADVVLSGVAIYEAVMEGFGFTELRVTTRGLRFADAGKMETGATPVLRNQRFACNPAGPLRLNESVVTSSETKPEVCPRCGEPLAGAELSSNCPRCLAALLLSPEPADIVESTSLPILRRLGDYELLKEVARGGMGVVFRARQVSLNRIVAIKVLRDAWLATPVEVKRFQAEAANVAKLKHPNIVAVHEVGEEDGQHYFAMDLVEGQNLAELTREGPLPPRRAAELVRKVAAAVQHAYQQGILHRDLKPSNVLLDTQDEPQVTDFGLARALDEDSSLTVTGQVLGTPGYMAPEQAKGGGAVGPAADVSGLGALLFHLLTGRAPFVGASAAETLAQLLQAEPLSPRLSNPTVPVDLAAVCGKCLAKSAGQRYGSAGELAEDLRRYLDGQATREE